MTNEFERKIYQARVDARKKVAEERASELRVREEARRQELATKTPPFIPPPTEEELKDKFEVQRLLNLVKEPLIQIGASDLLQVYKKHFSYSRLARFGNFRTNHKYEGPFESNPDLKTTKEFERRVEKAKSDIRPYNGVYPGPKSIIEHSIYLCGWRWDDGISSGSSDWPSSGSTGYTKNYFPSALIVSGIIIPSLNEDLAIGFKAGVDYVSDWNPQFIYPLGSVIPYGELRDNVENILAGISK